jgi:sec-independent protein translocase protein TatA
MQPNVHLLYVRHAGSIIHASTSMLTQKIARLTPPPTTIAIVIAIANSTINSKTITMNKLVVTFLALCVTSTAAFAPSSPRTFAVKTSPFQPVPAAPLVQQRHSVTTIAPAGLFGLGPAEIAVICIAGAFLLGPQKLAELGKDAGKIAGELKEVPKEFQKGLAEGEKQAQAVKKEMGLTDAVIEKKED